MEHQPKKHSACDECRARKLKCSGCPSGCQRCCRDKTTCVYSAQKPMGRPRKRRRDAGPIDEDEIRHPPNVPAELSTVDVAHPFISHIVTQQDSAEIGLFMSEFELLNNEHFDPTNGTANMSNLDGFPPLLETMTGNYSQIPLPHRASVVARRTEFEAFPPLGLQVEDTPLEYTTNGVATCFPGLGGQAPFPVSCSCLSSFFTTISTLRIPPPTHSVSLSFVLRTSSAALQAAQNSFTCESCHANVQSTYITNMLLGIQLPLLCQFFHRVLSSINATTDPQPVVMGDGQEMQLDVEPWQVLARITVRKEALKVLDLVAELERMTALYHGVPVAKIGNLADQSGNEPLCIRVLKTIKTVAEYITVR